MFVCGCASDWLSVSSRPADGICAPALPGRRDVPADCTR